MIKSNRAFYVASLAEFYKLEANVFAEIMMQRSTECGFISGDSEVKSWKENFNALKLLFVKSKLPVDVVIAFEYQAPVGGRIDCMICGEGRDLKKNVVVLELKAWTQASLSYNDTLIHTFTGGAPRDVDHPSIQAERYHQHLTNFIQPFDSGEINLTSLAYCYNYEKREDDALYHNSFSQILADYPLYTKEDKEILSQHLMELLAYGHGEAIYKRIAECQPFPTRKLLEAAADIIIENDNFYLIGDQDVAYKKILSCVKDAINKDKKSVFVVKGGPGTGKTVIALKIISEVAKMGGTSMFTTRSTALRDELIRALKNVKKNGRDASDLIANSIFKYRPSQYNENQIDVLLVDEAHRISDKSNDQTDGSYRVEVEHEGEGSVHSPLSQTMSLIYCSKVTVFFIDDHQAVRSPEIGFSETIIEKAQDYQGQLQRELAQFLKEQGKREAEYPQKRNELDEQKESLDENKENLSSKELENKMNQWKRKNSQLIRELKWGQGVQTVRSSYNDAVHVESITLETQFRCSGGDKFVAWLDEVLYKKADKIRLKLSHSDFDFEIIDSPSMLYEKIKRLNHQSSDDVHKRMIARLCAGWCWPWDDKQVDILTGDLKKEIVIGDFSMPWETKQRPPKEPYKSMYAPNTNEWPSHPMGINQIGCIYTAQGFEFDYVGVIIGPDLVYDQHNDCLKCIRELNQEKKMNKKNADTLIRNIYRVLLSRGKYGCYVYCCDSRVADYLKRFMNQ